MGVIFTPLWEGLYEKHLASLIEALKNTKQMRMMDVVKSERTLSEEEISNLEKALYKIGK